MPDSLEAGAILALLVGPGFIISIMERVVRPKRYASDVEWTLISVLRSMMIMIVSFGALQVSFGFLSIDLHSKLTNWASGLQLWQCALLIGTTYAFAFLWGIMLCRGEAVSLHRFARWVSKSGTTEFDSVWQRVFKYESGESSGPAKWIHLRTPTGAETFGRLRSSSIYVEQDKPIEAFISPAYERVNNRFVAVANFPGATLHGRYVKITDEMD